jgi:hypothetical protein
MCAQKHAGCVKKKRRKKKKKKSLLRSATPSLATARCAGELGLYRAGSAGDAGAGGGRAMLICLTTS